MSGPERRLRCTLLVLSSDSRTAAVSSTVVAIDAGSPKSPKTRLGAAGWSAGESSRREIGALGRLNQRVLRGSDFLQNSIQMFERFINRQRIHLSPVLITARLNEILQIVARSLDGERIGNHASSPFLVLHPRGMR